MTIIERALTIMEEKRLTKADLISLSGIKKSTLYNAFEEKTNPGKIKIETIQGIAKALNTTVDYLIYGNDKMKIKDPNSDNVHLNSEERKLVDIFKSLSKNYKETVLGYIDYLLITQEKEKQNLYSDEIIKKSS